MQLRIISLGEDWRIRYGSSTAVSASLQSQEGISKLESHKLVEYSQTSDERKPIKLHGAIT